MKPLCTLLLCSAFVGPALAQDQLATVESPVVQMELSRDGRYLAVVSNASTKVLKAWDTKTAKEVGRVEDAVLFDFSPTADRFVAGYVHSNFKIAMEVIRLPGWEDDAKRDLGRTGANAIAVGPDGKWYAQVVGHRSVSFVEMETGKVIRSGEIDIDRRYGSGPTHLAVSSDGKFLATYEYASGTDVWDASTLKRVARYPAAVARRDDGSITSNYQGFEDLAFVPGKRQLLIRDREGVQQLDFDKQDPVRIFKVRARHIGGFLKGGRICVVGDEFLDLETGRKAAMLPPLPNSAGTKGRALRTCVSADGSTLAALYHYRQAHLFDAEPLVAAWEEERKKPAKTKPAPKPKPDSKPAGGKVNGKPIGHWFQQLQAGEFEKRKAAMEALAKFGAKPVPKLVELLNHEHFSRRLRAAQALGTIGPAAKDAVPALEKLLDDPNDRVRKSVREALAKIRGDE